jgi:catechol 2,3-dioxygenase-like lactoylglutathione lyase family enzyme
MTITLNHTIVPTRDKAAAAKFFAHIFGLKRGRAGYFAPVRINKTLTLLFDDDSKFESHHLAFHVSKREFDAIFDRIKKAKVAFGTRRGVSMTVSSTTGAAAAASISAIPTGMCWRS